jgi:hypothetical protein
VFTTPAKAGFHRNGKAHGGHHRVHNFAGKIRVANQPAAASFSGDFADGATHIDVDQKSSRIGRSPGCIGHCGRMVIKQLHPDGPCLFLQPIHFEPSMPQLKAGGIHHFGKQQGIWSPTAYQLPKNPITDAS